ncbi:unnamed protein product [Protopolystoma xenopodis]|uniref:Uncharacterized protein n=1 Tax=Protopolystoma xenopodis TaxID=117903 RepID=A0A3S5FCD5_9PLAT|nr:unnamed protein product [Protopolystoma xenopodis]
MNGAWVASGPNYGMDYPVASQAFSATGGNTSNIAGVDCYGEFGSRRESTKSVIGTSSTRAIPRRLTLGDTCDARPDSEVDSDFESGKRIADDNSRTFRANEDFSKPRRASEGSSKRPGSVGIGLDEFGGSGIFCSIIGEVGDMSHGAAARTSRPGSARRAMLAKKENAKQHCIVADSIVGTSTSQADIQQHSKKVGPVY